MATLKQLYTFLAVAETLQMSEAARRLYISQPTVSQTILELEREFGASFFERSPKFLRLTAKGALFREYAPLLNRDGTTVYYVINPFRPWSATLEHIDQVLGETLGVSHVELARLRLVGNPNLGPETTPADVAEGARRLWELVSPYKPVDYLCVRRELCAALPEGLPCPVLPIRLWLTYPWATGPEPDAP